MKIFVNQYDQLVIYPPWNFSQCNWRRSGVMWSHFDDRSPIASKKKSGNSISDPVKAEADQNKIQIYIYLVYKYFKWANTAQQ